MFRARSCALVPLALALLACPVEQPQPTPQPQSAEAKQGREIEIRKQRCLDELVEDVDVRYQPLLRALCAESIDHDIPGVAVAVVERDGDQLKLVHHTERGLACSTADAPVDASTGFRVGSISKIFTAALALGLVAERGDLELTGPAVGRIDGAVLPESLADPSLAALLGHTSGLDEISPEAVVADNGDWRRGLTALPLDSAAPGFHYANANYVVVGALLEQIVGRSFEDLLRERIAEPLALGSVTSDPTQAVARGAACGHFAEDQDRHPVSPLEDLDFMPGDPSWLRPTGGVMASAEDLARFALMLGTPALPESAAMLEPGEPVPEGRGRDERYGLGLRSWRLGDYGRVYGHSGDNGSSHAELVFVPGKRAVVVLANLGVEMPATRAAAMMLLID